MARVQYQGGSEGLDLHRVFWTGSALEPGDAVCCINSLDTTATDDLNESTSVGIKCGDSDNSSSGSEYLIGIAVQNEIAAAGWITVVRPRKNEVLRVNTAASATITIGDAITVNESVANKFLGFTPAGTSAANIEEADIKTHAVALTTRLNGNQIIVKFI